MAAKPNDLELTRLCAEAVGLVVFLVQWASPQYYAIPDMSDADCVTFDPLHNDAQAMLLVKDCNLSIGKIGRHPGWSVTYREPAHDDYVMVMHDVLNRAIVECVARAQDNKR